MGTPQPIIVRNTGVGLDVALLQGFGSYSFQVQDPQQFVTQIVGQMHAYPQVTSKIACARCCFQNCKTCLAETTSKKNVLDLISPLQMSLVRQLEQKHKMIS